MRLKSAIMLVTILRGLFILALLVLIFFALFRPQEADSLSINPPHRDNYGHTSGHATLAR